MILEMKVPSPGESITEVEIATWLVEDGDYVIDIILFPIFEDIFDEDFDLDFNYRKSLGGMWITLFLVLGISYIIFKKRPRKKIDETDELNIVLSFIKKQGGRTTQKEIRKNLGLGEAKASLIITELEHKKIVQRIKKGRGNVIILNK